MSNVKTLKYTYTPTKTVYEMHQFVNKYWVEHNLNVIVGCKGSPESGKSVGAVQIMNMIKWNMPAVPDPDTGQPTKYSRIGICRATVAQIRESIWRTMNQGWFPTHFGRTTNTSSTANAPVSGHYRIPHPKGENIIHDVEVQGIYFGDDVEKSIERLKSVEFTAIYANEIQGLPPDIIKTLFERTGRYPSGDKGTSRARLVFVDYNQPPEGAWCVNFHEQNAVYTEKNTDGYRIDENFMLYEKDPVREGQWIPIGKHLDDVLDEGVIFIQYTFVQPPAALKVKIGEGDGRKPIYDYILNPNAEVPPTGKPNPYPALIAQYKNAKNYRDLERELCLLEVEPLDRKPVYGEYFDAERHIIENGWRAKPERFTIAGFDSSGMNPAIVLFQLTQHGWVITDSLYREGATLPELIQSLNSMTTEEGGAFGGYSKDRILISGDPANAKNQWTGLTPIQHFRKAGYYSVVAPTNAIDLRIDALRERLQYPLMEYIESNDREAGKMPGRLYVSNHVTAVIETLSKGHVYRRVAGAEPDVYHVRPDKRTKFSHYADAMEYGCLYINMIMQNHMLGDIIDRIKVFRDTVRYNASEETQWSMLGVSVNVVE